MPIQLIATDMDGTLLGADHVTIPERNIAALRRARERGVKIAVATGRSWSLIRETADTLGGLDYAIVSNGAAVLEVPTGRWLFRHCFSNPQALAVIELLDGLELPFEVYCEGQNYVSAKYREVLSGKLLSAEFWAFYARVTCFPEDLEAALDGREAEKFNILYVPPDRRQEVLAGLTALCPVEATRALGDNMELNPVGVSKALVLRELSASLGLTANEVMAFGDAENDAEMLRFAGWSFAMANADAEAKAAARYAAPYNYDGGVGQMVEKYVLCN